MRFIEIERHLSVPRIHKYLSLCGNKTRAIKLYKANMKLSQSFHPVLGIIEIAIRNNINEALTAHFGDSDWIINQKTGFMSHRNLRKGRFYLRKRVEQAEYG